MAEALDAFASVLDEGKIDQVEYDYFESLEYGIFLLKTRMQFFLSLFLVCIVSCQTSFAVDLINVPQPSFPTLWESSDVVLQQKLEKVVKQQGLWRQVTNKHLALVVVEIGTLQTPRLAELNGNQMYYAASLPKIAILLGAFVEIEAGKLKETQDLYKQMTDMIRYSSNTAANYVLSLVGGERILQILQDPDFALYDPQHNGGLWVGKPYGKSGAYHRDPLYNLSHGATAIQVARFYYLLETQQLLTPEYTLKMKEILSKPGISHKFVKGLEKVPEIEIYRKSGTWKNCHADSALVECKDSRYIIVGLSDSKHGEKWMEKLGLPLHTMITGKE